MYAGLQVARGAMACFDQAICKTIAAISLGSWRRLSAAPIWFAVIARSGKTLS